MAIVRLLLNLGELFSWPTNQHIYAEYAMHDAKSNYDMWADDLLGQGKMQN